MQHKINFEEKLTHQIFNITQCVAAQINQPAYVVGGFVRDLLLNRPSKDIDIVTIGSGIALAKKIANSLKPVPKVSVFKNFGTAMFYFQGFEIEFVGARKESYQRNSRKPIVEDGTLQDDQNRRDFTINAMAISLNMNDYGALIDPFGGLLDLKEKTIRTPLEPGITFSDDPLRMMRGIRFATQLNFTIEKHTLNAITANNQRITIVSQERITDELNKILLASKPSKGFALLEKTGLLPLFFSELSRLKGVQTMQGNAHKDNFWHTIAVVDNISKHTNDLWLRWAALLHDVGKPKTKRYVDGGWTFHGHEHVGGRMIPEIFKHLRLPLNEKMRYVQKLVELHLRPIALTNDEVTDSALRRLLFDAGDDIDDLMTLAEADITSKNEGKVQRFRQHFAMVRQKLKEIEEKDAIRNFQPPVSGNDIIETFGVKPGPEIGVIKNAIKDAILDGLIQNNRNEAFQFMLDKGHELGLHPKE